MNVKQIFVNLPVKNLDKTIAFFTSLGFEFNSKFTNENATCMIIGKNMFAMLLTEKFFKGFIKKEICDSKKSTEVLVALQLNSRKEVDEIVTKAVSSGGKESREVQDLGFMYSRTFEDLDGHIWEPFVMDESKVNK